MNRAEKTEAIDKLKQTFESTPHVILARFSGLRANQANELRKRIRQVDGSYEVVKNRLAKRAASGTAIEQIAERFTGPCAVAGHASDPIVLAKTLSEFSKENPELELLIGLIDGRMVVDAKGVKQLASLPGLPEQRAQLLALIQTPASTLVRLLATPGIQLARVLDCRRRAQETGD